MTAPAAKSLCPWLLTAGHDPATCPYCTDMKVRAAVGSRGIPEAYVRAALVSRADEGRAWLVEWCDGEAGPGQGLDAAESERFAAFASRDRAKAYCRGLYGVTRWEPVSWGLIGYRPPADDDEWA